MKNTSWSSSGVRLLQYKRRLLHICGMMMEMAIEVGVAARRRDMYTISRRLSVAKLWEI